VLQADDISRASSIPGSVQTRPEDARTVTTRNTAADAQMTQDQHRQAAALVAQVQDIPTLPDIYFRIRSILQDPASSHQDVAATLGTDPGIAARLLRMANSAFYGRPGTIDTIERAVGLLGTQQVHDLVLATTMIHTLEGMRSEPLDPRKFWYSSVLTGAAAKLLAERCDILDCERLFVAGLLAQIGQLVLCHARPEELRSILDEAHRTGQPCDRLQRERIGFDYADVSGELFSLWGLPGELVTPIRLHTRPGDAGDDLLEAAILHIAVRTATMASGDQGIEALLPTLDDQAWQATALTLEDLKALRNDAVQLADGIVPLILSNAA
jgi:HD-like signal output (HDOD) protein